MANQGLLITDVIREILGTELQKLLFSHRTLILDDICERHVGLDLGENLGCIVIDVLPSRTARLVGYEGEVLVERQIEHDSLRLRQQSVPLVEDPEEQHGDLDPLVVVCEAYHSVVEPREAIICEAELAHMVHSDSNIIGTLDGISERKYARQGTLGNVE